MRTRFRQRVSGAPCTYTIASGKPPVAPPATVRASWVCWRQRACRSAAPSERLSGLLSRPLYSAFCRALLFASSVRACDCLAARCRKSTVLATIGPGAARSVVLSTLDAPARQPMQPCCPARNRIRSFSLSAVQSAVVTPDDHCAPRHATPRCPRVQRRRSCGGLAAVHLLSTAHSTCIAAAQSAECAD